MTATTTRSNQPAASGGMPGLTTCFRLLVVVPLLMLLGGCGHNYTPDPSRPFESINEFTSTGSIDLQNGQPSKKQVRFFGHPPGPRYNANLNAWTDVAIAIAARELQKRGMVIASGAPRTLTMSIDSANADEGMVQTNAEIVMHVKTSDGYSASYVGTNNLWMAPTGLLSPPVPALLYGGSIVSYQIDGAMMRVVHEMLMDPQIVDFLTK